MVFRGFNHTKTPMARFAPRVTTASLLALLAIAAAGPIVVSAHAQEAERPTGLFDRIFSGSERFGGGSERAAPTDRTAQMSGSDVVLRLDRLETQIRQLTGVIEQLQFRNQQLEGQLRRLQEDTDYRFQESSTKGAPRPALQSRPQTPPPQPSAPATTGAPGRRGDAFDPTQNPNAPGAPHTLGSIGGAGAPSPMSPSMGDAADEPRAGDEGADPPQVAPHEQHEGAHGEGPQDPVAEDLERAGGLQRREVEREEAPDAVGEEAVDRAAPDLAVGGRVGCSRPLRVRRGRRGHPTVQVSRPCSSSARSASVAGPPAVSTAASTWSRTRSS